MSAFARKLFGSGFFGTPLRAAACSRRRAALGRFLAPCLLVVVLGGCVAPQSQLEAMKVQNRVLADQNQAQLVEIENLKVHARKTENHLKQAEEQLALLDERVGLGDQQLARYRQQSELLQEQFLGAAHGRGRVPDAVA